MATTPVPAEGHHPSNGHPRWSQSYYFNFYDPETEVGGFFRMGLLETVRKSNVWCVLFRGGKPIYNRICGASPYTPERMDQGVEVAGLRFLSIEPLAKARLTFQDDDCRLDLLFTAIHPMADSISMTKNQGGAMASEIAAAHLEGPVRVSGTLVLRGRQIDIEGTGFRDVSWGVRNWESLHRYRLAWPVFANGMAPALIHATSTTGDHLYMKMFHDGEAWRGVGEVEDGVEFEADGMTARSADWRFRDSRDRDWRFTGRPIFRYFFPFDGFLLAEHMMEFRLGDGTVGYGLLECGFRLPWEGA